MKIYRGPRTKTSWSSTTDQRDPSNYISTWEPGKPIAFDGTIEKNGERHTDIGVGIDEDDVFALFNAVINRYINSNKELNKRVDNLQQRIVSLEKSLTKIRHLIYYHAKDAPSKEALIQAIVTIANHFLCGHKDHEPPKLEWIEWNSIFPW